MLCKNCNTEVKQKLDISWPIIIISVLLFWPATVIYLLWKYNTQAYVCPICNVPFEAAK
jgi:hypothetical protein